MSLPRAVCGASASQMASKVRDLVFASHRSPVVSRRGMVASSQPLASEAGLRILQQGGTAADAAVAMAAALGVTEPCSTGIGGDAFALFYSAVNKRVECLKGGGMSPKGLTFDAIRERGIVDQMPMDHALTVVVPGAPMLWEDALKKWGRKSLEQVLEPAIELAEQGFPVAPLTATHWKECAVQLQGPGKGALLNSSGKPPEPGEVMVNADLAATFRKIAKQGARGGFYSGPVADAVVRAVQDLNGVLDHDDMESHATVEVEPISTTYRGLSVWEVPPPNQ
ncbi:unnamed protein product, partial [Ostreobium quekettii]